MTGDRRWSQDLVLINVHGGSTQASEAVCTSRGDCIWEYDAAKVGERCQAAIDWKVFNNPFCIKLAKFTTKVGRECMVHRCTRRQVFDNNSARIYWSSFNAHIDHVTSRDLDIAEIMSIIWIPFIPSTVWSTVSLYTKVEARLQDNRRAGITVNTDPGRSTVAREGIGPTGKLRCRNCNLSGDRSVSIANKHGSSPIWIILFMWLAVQIEYICSGWFVGSTASPAYYLRGPSAVMDCLSLRGERGSRDEGAE